MAQHPFTRQLRAEYEGALSESKKFMVVLSSDSPDVRPSGTLGRETTSEDLIVLRRDPTTGDWYNREAVGKDKMAWKPVPVEDVRQLAGSGSVDPQAFGGQ